MKITIDTNAFYYDKIGLLNLLYSLNCKGLFTTNEEIEKTLTTSPALAYKYVIRLTDAKVENGNYIRSPINSSLEKVFLKNIKYAIKYLKITGQDKFVNAETEKKFREKLFKDPVYSYLYSAYVIKSRLPEDKEEVFLKNYKCLYHYALNIIGNTKTIGSISHSLDKKINLLSFDRNQAGRWDYNYLMAYINKNMSARNYYYLSEILS
jgi:hypothetical protein